MRASTVDHLAHHDAAAARDLRPGTPPPTSSRCNLQHLHGQRPLAGQHLHHHDAQTSRALAGPQGPDPAQPSPTTPGAAAPRHTRTATASRPKPAPPRPPRRRARRTPHPAAAVPPIRELYYFKNKSRRKAATSASASGPATTTSLKVGDALRSGRRRFTEADVAAYAAVSGDRNPVHLDDAFARGAGGFARGRVVHGMLAASLFPALIASRFPGAVYASQSLRFAAPVYVGDEAAAEVRALNIKSAGGRHIVKFTTKCFANGHEDGKDTLAIDGEAMVFLPTLQLGSEAIAE
ncbi:3-hydroxyacyl-[acyl-carrier-protein] dehydratase, mitochondrial-like [Lolium perenne]|uniref:3-hydroxyacyl-[acyl-carrier-protein] dehydratase, mitochondrial-like n=1 Tax=Lolium perenne TaxID=4522 RepID=UPI003A990C8B